MTKYRFDVDARFSGLVAMSFDNDEDALRFANNHDDELAMELVNQGDIPSADIDFIEKYNEETEKWEAVND